MTDRSAGGAVPLPNLGPESLEDLYEKAPCGYLIAQPDGTIARVNQTFLRWSGRSAEDLVGRRRFSELLANSGHIFYETHFAPLLALQGDVRELAFDLARRDGPSIPILVSATNVEATALVGAHVRITVFDATQRHEYETELLRARKAAEASEQQLRSVAETLQRSLMSGGVEQGPGFVVETRYRPAVETLEVGGDWHDAFLIDGGATIAISVGDVVGRGIAAACAMGQVRSALRAIAGSGVGPGAVLDQLDEFVDRLPDAQSATIAYAEIDTRNGHMRYACAGHPPPLHIDADGAATYLWEGRSPPVGIAFEPRPEAELSVQSDDRILMYTDGLIERRLRDLESGFEVLRVAAAALHGVSPADMADRLMADLLVDEEKPDDVCLLIHQRTS